MNDPQFEIMKRSLINQAKATVSEVNRLKALHGKLLANLDDLTHRREVFDTVMSRIESGVQSKSMGVLEAEKGGTE